MPTGADGRLLPAEAGFLRAEIERRWQNVNRFAVMRNYDPSYLSRLLGSKREPGTKKGAGIGLGQLRDLCKDIGIDMWRVFSESEQEAPPPPPLTITDIAEEIQRLGRELEMAARRPGATQEVLALADAAERQAGPASPPKSSESSPGSSRASA